MTHPPLLIAPPNDFSGTIGDLVEEFIIPNLPSADSLIAWTEVLLRYMLQAPDPILIVRGPNKGHLRRVEGAQIVHSDNAPGIWCCLRCFDQSIDPFVAPKYIADGNIPVLMALAADKREGWNYGQKLSNADKGIWAQGMKHCHLLPLRTPGLSPRQQSLRNLCPLNHFLFVSPKKYKMHRIGWSEPGNVADLGESGSIISWIQHRLSQLLGKKGLSVYNRFLAAVAGTQPHASSSNLRIRLVRKEANPTRADRNSVGARQVSSVDPTDATPKSATRRNWTLNEQHGYYVATRLKDRVINLELRFKRLTGETAAVGQFLLDLKSLSEAGVVARRAIEGGIVFDVRIVRDRQGAFWLGVRNDPRVPLRGAGPSTGVAVVTR